MNIFNKNKKELISGNDNSSKLSNSENFHKFFNKLPSGGKGYAYVYLNIKDFKQINDVFGYDTGNNVLKNMADIIQGYLHNDESASKFIADEFALLLKFENQENFSDRIAKIINGLENVEITNGSIVFKYNCSLICSIYEIIGNELSFDDICNIAKDTYTRAKKQDGSTYVFFDKSMQESIKFRMKLLPMVQNAIEQRQLIPYFQPKYELKTKNIISAQIIAQWNHPEFGLIEPTDFTFVLESSGNILKLDLYLLEQACKLLQKWMNDECMPVPLTIDISKYNLYELNFVDRVMRIINQYDVPTCLIVLQINSAVLWEHPAKAFEVMTTLHNNGFILSVDNFGQDHISLDVVCEFPINVLNLNHEFIKKARESDKIKNALRSVVALTRQLEISISSDGFGDVEQEAFLQQIRCELVQSNLYSNLQSIEEFEKLIF
ncbi:MAG: EAL domain-containing protein [Oscillospiraceae bacterium]